MRLLTIDTSGQIEIVGIVDSGRVLAEMSSPVRRRHSRTLLAAVDAVLDKASIELGDLDGIVVSIGPGRFSGLRVGLATAMGLVAAGRCRIWGVSTL
ncbi:tRNA (adenosine(37)-N6)-threonylcarbamoyltransferase complex dimerization subunit type 1 TsaB, partial [bacterium]|nr:tRNA (adenosine(37)-N6)-threonylcarbamoyltransferase complex dimerization subunit type 1 TsaB [bacterium]